MPNKTKIVAEPGTPLLTITRTFNAPRELVFRCFTEPELLAKWLGPRHIGTTSATGDNRHSGQWTFVQHDPGGNEYRFRGVFHGDPSVDGIVRTFEYEGAPGHVSLESAVFHDEPGGATTVVNTAVHLSVEARDAMIEAGMEHGVVEGNERLDELLLETRAGDIRCGRLELSGESTELAMYEQSAAVFREVLAAVAPGDLGLPTPCAEWDVRTVVSHVILGNRWAVDMLTSGTGAWPPGEDAIGDAEPLAAFDESVARVTEAFGEPGAMDKVVPLPMGDHPAPMLLGIAGGQFLEHAWDIAKATGQSTDIAPELCEAVLEGSRGALNDQTRGDFYGPEQPTPAGATAADRMAAFMGRKV